MRYFIASLLIAGCLPSAAVAFQAVSGGPSAGAACVLLPRDLLMKALTADGQTLLAGSTPSSDSAGMSVAKGSSVCIHDPVTLVIEPSDRADLIRTQMRNRTGIYKDYEPVPSVGTEAFFWANRQFAYIYVWRGSRHFMIEMRGDAGGDAKVLKPNVIMLAQRIVPQLR
jgi:hypothetical protein